MVSVVGLTALTPVTTVFGNRRDVGAVVAWRRPPQHVQPEHDVLRGDRGAVGPLVVLQRDRDLVAVEHRRVGKADRVVHRWLVALAEPVQRPVQQVLQVVRVGDADVRAAREREDVVRRRRRRQRKGGRAAADLRTARRACCSRCCPRSPPRRPPARRRRRSRLASCGGAWIVAVFHAPGLVPSPAAPSCTGSRRGCLAPVSSNGHSRQRPAVRLPTRSAWSGCYRPEKAPACDAFVT